MAAFPRRLSLAGLLVWTLCAQAGQGYLPVVGPPALRFETPRLAPLPEVVLPPLPVVEPRVTAGTPEPTAPVAPVNPGIDALQGNADESTNADPALTIVQPFLVPFTPLATEPWGSGGPGSAATVMVPQMFMKYFTGQPGTNSLGVSIFAPVGFVPPMPAPAPSSTATFETVPVGKP